MEKIEIEKIIRKKEKNKQDTSVDLQAMAKSYRCV